MFPYKFLDQSRRRRSKKPRNGKEKQIQESATDGIRHNWVVADETHVGVDEEHTNETRRKDNNNERNSKKIGTSTWGGGSGWSRAWLPETKRIVVVAARWGHAVDIGRHRVPFLSSLQKPKYRTERVKQVIWAQW